MSVYEKRESVVFENDGQILFGILHLPKHTMRPPCVLMCHGMGGHKTGRYRVYVDLAEALTKAGIAAFRFDFRGSGDSEGSYDDMTITSELSDALCALKYLEQEPRIDQSQIGIFGRSLGGAIAILTAAQSEKINSIVLWATLFDGQQWKHQWDQIVDGGVTEQESYEMRCINGQVASVRFYEEMFSMQLHHELKKLDHVPLLLMHGKQDELISCAHSERCYAERKSSPSRTELVLLPHADHDFGRLEDRIFAVAETVKWYQETLKRS